MNQQTSDFPTDRVPTRDVLRKTNRAMDQLIKTISDLEQELLLSRTGDLMGQKDLDRPLQKLDLILQMSDEISGLLNRTAEQIPLHHNISAQKVLFPVRLEILRNFISDPHDSASGQASDPRPPQVTLF